MKTQPLRDRDQSTVFVVDDDPAMRRAFKGLLGSAQHPVELYAGAQEFLDAYDPQ